MIKFIKLINQNNPCICFVSKYNSLNSGNVINQISNAMRISRVLQLGLQPRVYFGNYTNQSYLFLNGGREGQNGGLPRPLRNKF